MLRNRPQQTVPRVSDDLKELLRLAGGRAMPVREILAHTQGRGLQTLCIVLSLPFLSPVAIPLLSLPFGAAIAICGLRMAFRHGPWLPECLLKRSIPPGALEKILHFGIAAHTRLEKFLRVRWALLAEGHAAVMAGGLAIALAAVLLSLPIPPPFPLTNTIPGFAIIFLCLGFLERDGVSVAIGYALTTLGLAYVALILLAGRAGFETIWHWCSVAMF